jgi:hypothetical protein
MSDEKWIDLKQKIKEKFGDFESHVEDTSREDDIGNKIPETTETVEFNSPLGELRLVRVSHPKIVDKKAHYHKGSGGAKVEFILSPDEMTHKLTIYKRDDMGEWRPLEVPAENLSF